MSKKTLRLKPSHRWQARPGHKIFVLDKGAVRFDIPESWVIALDPDSTKIYDKQPPDDDCVLGVSYLRLPPIDWSGLPLRNLLDEGTKGVEREVLALHKPVELRRGDLEIVWREMHFTDPKEHREAISLICLGRRKLIQCLITF